MWFTEKSINVIYSGDVEGHQNSLISRLCDVGIKTEPYRIIPKDATCIWLVLCIDEKKWWLLNISESYYC